MYTHYISSVQKNSGLWLIRVKSGISDGNAGVIFDAIFDPGLHLLLWKISFKPSVLFTYFRFHRSSQIIPDVNAYTI